MTDPNVFRNCAIQIHGMIGLTLGACCVDNGTVGGTCSNETYGDCVRRGTRVFWHEGLTCGGSPCGKTGACSLMFTTTSSQYSTLCLNGITCIDCIAGRVYDSKGITYNPASFTYLGNGITCTSLNTPEEA